MLNELLRVAPLQDGLFSLRHRTGARGREIDIVAESRRRLVALVVKASSSVARADLRHLRWFADEETARGGLALNVIEVPVSRPDRRPARASRPA